MIYSGVRVLPDAEPLLDRAEGEVGNEEQRDANHQRVHLAEAAEDEADSDEADDGGAAHLAQGARTALMQLEQGFGGAGHGGSRG